MATISRSRAESLSRGTLSKLTGCNIETIRYYEQIGLIPAPPRSNGGHRQYGDEHLRRLTFIRRSRELGFSLRDVRELLELVDGGETSCAEVMARTLRQAQDIRQKVADLKKIARVLETMAARCDDGTVPACPVIEALFNEPGTTASPR